MMGYVLSSRAEEQILLRCLSTGVGEAIDPEAVYLYLQVRRCASPLSTQSGQWVSVQNSLFVFVLFHVLRLGSLQHMNNSLWKTF